MSCSNESIIKTLLAVAEIYEKEISAEQQALYCSFLNKLTEEQLARALREHVETSTWWPRPSDILKLAKKYEVGPKKIDEKPMLQVCGNTQDLVNKYGDRRKMRVI